jgi:acetoin utilization protein AcuB/CBS domain-containing protein
MAKLTDALRQSGIPAEQEIRFWMRAPAITVNLAEAVSEALTRMREHNVRRLPVVLDTGELRGMITQGDIRGADLLRIAGMDPLDIADALRRVKVYEVVDEHNTVVGIVTESDLFEALVQQLEG